MFCWWSCECSDNPYITKAELMKECESCKGETIEKMLDKYESELKCDKCGRGCLGAESWTGSLSRDMLICPRCSGGLSILQCSVCERIIK